MTYFKLGDGKYAVAQSHRHDGVPSLTIRRLAKPVAVGELLEQTECGTLDHDLIIDVETPAAAGVLLAVAQAIAFAHGIVDNG